MVKIFQTERFLNFSITLLHVLDELRQFNHDFKRKVSDAEGKRKN